MNAPTSSPSIALATAREARDLDEDLPPLEAALRDRHARADIVVWDDASVDWSAYDLVLLRSTWDYTTRLPEFLAWAERVTAITRLANPLEIVRWNTDKHYLADLAARGVAVVPSAFIEPGMDVAAVLDAWLEGHDAAEFVVKPAVGAGSRDAQRYVRADRNAAVAHAMRLADAGRSVLLQPYLDRVDEAGETALLFFNGPFSHAIRKGPLLRRGEASTNTLFAPETVSSRVPAVEEVELATRALVAIPFDTPLYARVDIIRDAENRPCILELELTEPSLFFAHAQGSAERFAAVVVECAERSRVI